MILNQNSIEGYKELGGIEVRCYARRGRLATLVSVVA